MTKQIKETFKTNASNTIIQLVKTASMQGRGKLMAYKGTWEVVSSPRETRFQQHFISPI